MEEPKFKLSVETLPKPARISGEELKRLRELVKGKLLKRMKSEAVRCPLRNELVPFIKCFTCGNFIMRIRGQVYCRGDPSAVK